jgi:hypothetical protein
MADGKAKVIVDRGEGVKEEYENFAFVGVRKTKNKEGKADTLEIFRCDDLLRENPNLYAGVLHVYFI